VHRGGKEYLSSFYGKLEFLCALCGWSFRKPGKRLSCYVSGKKLQINFIFLLTFFKENDTFAAIWYDMV
jgi:hypothetical protein